MRGTHGHPASRRSRLPAAWQLARLAERDSAPAAGDWIPATVPGAVQLDWAQGPGTPDPYYGSNVRFYAGLEDSHWLYRTEIPKVALSPDERLAPAPSLKRWICSCAAINWT